MLKIKLSRDLRKTILRGHPWIYRQAIEKPAKTEATGLCQVVDKKGSKLAWAIYSSQGPLALRILSLDKKPPGSQFYQQKIQSAWQLRQPLLAQSNAFRLVNGEGDGLPGFVCDLYDNVAVMQFDGQSCFDFWDQEWLANELLALPPVKAVFQKPRRSDDGKGQWWGEVPEGDTIEISENGKKFCVDVVNGQKTGFFLDQRDNRNHVSFMSQGKKVLNLFSYTGGFSIYAGCGGASEVTSVDLSKPAIELAQKSWTLNGLDSQKHFGVAEDVFDFLNRSQQQWDMVIVDPPSMAPSEKHKEQAIKSYEQLFKQAAQVVASGGDLVLSSCSSHISFPDFFLIIDNALSGARRTGQNLKISGQGMDHPFPQSSFEMRYLKFVHLKLN